VTTWGSKNAEDLYNVATRLAGFDPFELMREITKLSTRGASRVNESTVANAMQAIEDRYEALPEEEKAKIEDHVKEVVGKFCDHFNIPRGAK